MESRKISPEDMGKRFDMPDIDAFEALEKYCDEHKVKLIAISKKKPAAAVRKIYDTGHKLFGENKVQELTDKQGALPSDIQWHMVGHLQRNKVKYIVPFVAMIESVDSLRLLKEINKRAKKEERVVDCLLQMHIAEESTKFGLDEAELKELLDSDSVQIWNMCVFAD
jgi:pyridoxal phosphate enzyme (YggS family)